jgi:RNA polymerase sigma-70 factor (sigma-E family)
VQDDPADFVEFATARSGSLFRTALLLCGDWHLAEDLVQTTLAKTYRSWWRVRRANSPTAYTRSILVRSYLSQRRLRGSGELPWPTSPDRSEPEPDVALWVTLLAALAKLRAGDRAVLVLRYWEDMSVAETAAELHLTEGAVRNRAMRALAVLRGLLSDDEEANRAHRRS